MRHTGAAGKKKSKPGTMGASARTFRRQVLAMHRAIFRRNQERINTSVYGYTPAFRTYEREYARRVRRYERRVRLDELEHAIDASRVVYVGDYHTLPQSQRAFLRLLRKLPPDRPVTLGLEFFQGRHQKLIDAWLAGSISEDVFLRRIGYAVQTPLGTWESFLPIFELARERGYRIVALDRAARGAAGETLRVRDRYAAARLASAMCQRPDDLVMVLIGELHVAPGHLPNDVQRALGPDVESLRQLVIYQNCHQIYWELEARGLEHDVELVRVRADEYCLMNTPPIVCQQSFLNWLDVEDGMTQPDAPEQNFKEYARLIAEFFELPLGSALDDVELATVVDLSFLARLKRRGDFSARDIRHIRHQILNSESYFIPRAKMVYLGNLSVNHASEEATHFLRFVASGNDEPRLLVDAFYARCVEEALGFLGSKIINHKRKCAREVDLV
ncbi:MAG: ChaN family lipoprotein, partial [Myxococcota bacterium]